MTCLRFMISNNDDDGQLQVRKASKLQLEKMFLRRGEGQSFRQLPADELSMVQLQGHFLKKYFISADECVNNAPLPKPNGRSKVAVSGEAGWRNGQLHSCCRGGGPVR